MPDEHNLILPKCSTHRVVNVESAMKQTDNFDCSDFKEIVELELNTELYGGLTDVEICSEVQKMTTKMNS